MTYKDYLRKYNYIDITDDNNTFDDLKVFCIRDVLQSSNLTNEQKEKFLDKETDSLDNFYNDFEVFMKLEI